MRCCRASQAVAGWSARAWSRWTRVIRIRKASYSPTSGAPRSPEQLAQREAIGVEVGQVDTARAVQEELGDRERGHRCEAETEHAVPCCEHHVAQPVWTADEGQTVGAHRAAAGPGVEARVEVEIDELPHRGEDRVDTP